MKEQISKFVDKATYFSWTTTLLLGVGVFLFWLLVHPEALSYQEQNQLFLWTGDYFLKDISQPGGFADWLAEFCVQFYYVIWLGALVLALLAVIIQRLSICLADASCRCGMNTYQLSLAATLPSIIMLWGLGDENTLLSTVTATIIAATCGLACRKLHILFDIVAIPVLYWLIGPITLLYICIRIALSKNWKLALLSIVYFIAIELLASWLFLQQWPFWTTIWGLNYYRIPMEASLLQFMLLAFMLLFVLKMDFTFKTKYEKIKTVAIFVVVIAFVAVTPKWYDADKYALIKEDYQIRNGRWQDIITDAQKHQVEVNFCSECVNLALAKTGQLADRMFSFYQSGNDALLMPMVRDNTSNLPTMEAFWNLGMVNECMRYAFDIQESILNGKKSGRLMKRISECCIINGRYKTAAKYLDMLEHTLFYKEWASHARSYLGNEAWINGHPEWGRIRQMRYKEDFLYNYYEMDKMLGILFQNNPHNKMALEYFLGQMLLLGNVQGFMDYLGWAQQYGGYQTMPYSYQDAYQCIKSHGQMPNSPYGEYVRRMQAQAQADGTTGASPQAASAH